MDRRAFIGTLASGLLAAPLPAGAQPTGKVWRIGVIVYAAKTAGRRVGRATCAQASELVVKRLELLKQLVPTAAPVAVLWDQDVPYQWGAVRIAAREQRGKLLSLPIREVGEIEKAVTSATNARAGRYPWPLP